MMLKYILPAIFILFPVVSFAQSRSSIHEEENSFYSKLNINSEKDWNAYNGFSIPEKISAKAKKQLQKEVFGWHPYWSGALYLNYDFDLLSEISYFSYAVNSATGYPTTVRDWLTTDIVSTAHAHGTRVSLTATLFSDHSTFFENSAAVSNFIDSIVSLIEYRDADGINIDFEAVASSNKVALADMMVQLSAELKARVPGAKLSIALPAVDWASTFDVVAMRDAVDLFLIMGYEYYWSGSGTAGPGAPKHSGDIWGTYTTTRSVFSYLEKGIPKEKLCLGLPYYGREWETSSYGYPATAVATGSSKTYRQIMDSYQSYEYFFDEHSATPMYVYPGSAETWRQCWFNDEKSLARQYDFVNQVDIAGIGIWALGYDNGYSNLWNVLEEKFSDVGNTTCEGVFYDTGGKFGSYRNAEDWTYIITPKNAQSLNVQIESFETETNYDTLWIYNKTSASGDALYTLTGTNFPTSEFTTNGAITFRFKSDKATVSEGWAVRWSCVQNQANEQGGVSRWALWPNPTSGQIKISNLENTKAKLTIFDSKGLIFDVKYLTKSQTTIHIEQKGIYIFKIETDTKSETHKVIVN